MKNIGVLISGGGTNLQALIDAQGSVLKSGKIVCVCSNSANAYGLTRAKKAGIPTKIIRKNADCGGDADKMNSQICNYMKSMGVDVIVLAGYLGIVGGELLKEYENKIINIHPSLIPSFCGEGMYGLKVHEAALKHGVKVTGATAHLVNEVVDGGKILLQKRVRVRKDDTPQILQRRVMEQAEWKILPKAVNKVCMGGKQNEKVGYLQGIANKFIPRQGNCNRQIGGRKKRGDGVFHYGQKRKQP